MIQGYGNLRGYVLGERLPHTFSPKIHSFLADYSYGIKEIAKEELGKFITCADFDFLNVTIPYKKDVIKYLSTLSKEAEIIGAVNTVKKMPDGTLCGYNTDYYGFEYTLKKSGIQVNEKKALVLGSGGASLPIKAVLSEHGAKEIITISRSGENNYDNISKHYDADIIVNTTPVGMFPSNGDKPIALTKFTSCVGVIDIIYNPIKTALLLEAEALGINCCGGLTMLVAQAKKAAEIFTDTEIDDAEINRIERIISCDMSNIVLIGMPSCGKSTIGRFVADETRKSFFDSDEEFTRTFGITPEEAITNLGEEKFREMEHEVIKELAKKTGCVISTGGGVVTRKENYAPLRQNGAIFFIERDITKLIANNRPLSQKFGVDKLYAERLPLYLDFCDHRVYNNGEAKACVEEIVSIVRKGF